MAGGDWSVITRSVCHTAREAVLVDQLVGRGDIADPGVGDAELLNLARVGRGSQRGDLSVTAN